jgi:hypothetical protein
MKPSHPADADAIARRLAQIDDATIDELYGLEPVYEPDVAAARGGSPTEVVVVTCPYCWEQYETEVDLTGGSSTYVEDCQVCCQPIELSLEVSDSGALVALLPNRMD